MEHYLKTDKLLADQNLYKLETRKKVKKSKLQWKFIFLNMLLLQSLQH